jgi:two-component system sensor histidine kinase RstB
LERELLQVVSHELRTPLARIHFAIDLIRDADTPEERQTRVDSLDRSANELDGLVAELLQYLQIETGLLALNREELPVRATTQELYDELVPQNPHLKMDFGLDLSQTELIAVLDQRRTRRVLRNIIGNATRFAASRIQLNAVIKDGDLLVHIDDDGPGIREEDRARIFEPFFRGERNGGSAGLGLALVYHFVTRVGGNVTVTDSPLGGARFVLDIPQKRNGLHLRPASEEDTPASDSDA